MIDPGTLSRDQSTPRPRALRRRTWRVQLAADWLNGTSFAILGIRRRMRPVEVEQAVRQVVAPRYRRQLRRRDE